MSEEWRPVVGHEGKYEVSDLARVRSLDRVTIDSIGRRKFFKGKLLTPCLTGSPQYPTVGIWVSGVGRQNCRIHVLVLAAFVGPRPKGFHIRHLDGNPFNSQLSNLAYGTVSENQIDTVRHGRNFYALKTHCVHGHEYTPENTYWRDKRGRGRLSRQCRECTLARARKQVSA